MSVDKQQIIEMIRAKSPRLSLVDFKGGKSEAWGRFRRVQVDNVTLPYAVCNGCFKPVHYTPRDGTGGLRRHTCEFTVAMSQPQAGRTTRPADKHHGTDQSASSNTNAAKKSSAKLQGEPLQTQHESHAFKLQQQLYAAHRAGLLNMASHQVLTNLMAAKVHPFHELVSRLTSPPVAPAPATTSSPSSASLSPPVASGSSSSKSPQGISDIALDLAAKRSRQESGNVAMDLGDPNALIAQQDRPTKRRRKRSHPDRTVRPGPCVSSTGKTEECPVGEDPVSQFEDEPLNLTVSSTREKQPSAVITTSQDESTSALDYSMKPHDLKQSEIVVKVEASSTNTDEGTESKPPVNDKESCSNSGSSEPLLEMKLTDLRSYLVKFLDTHRQISEELEDKMPVPDLQKPAPQFSGIAVVDGQFKNISLEDYKGKYVVLFFYPLDFTFVCPTEIIAFSERAEEFRQIGCELIACSTDSHFCHLAWVNTPRKQGGLGSMNIPLLADKSGAISKAYGVYKDDEGLTFRGLFIIDGNQNLRQVTINDLPVGRSVDETLRLVQAFQFTDKHGEVCPAGWTPGKKSMKADPSGSKEYFESQH